MLIIASNITSRNPRVARILQDRISGGGAVGSVDCPGIKDIAESCLNASADVLEVNLQQRFGRPDIIEFVVKVVQEVTDHQICLSVNSVETLEAGLKCCKRPPIINYSSPETDRMREVLPLAVKYGAELVLLISDPGSPGDAPQMLEKAAVMVGAANEAGIPNERIILDPGILHVTKEQGQSHLVEVTELLRTIPETFDPPVRTTCWLGNSSAGAPARLRPVIETALLAMLSGIGLSSVFLDILRKENRRAVRLLKIFRNEEIYADDNLLL